MVLWLVDQVQFLRYTVAMFALSFAGFVVFLLVPVAPPWLAARHHLLPGVHPLIALPSAVSPYYQHLNPDPAAAFPSLHAAYPLLAALALWPVTRRGATLALAWTVTVWFSVVYLGQHYITDIIGGMAFAVGTWMIVTQLAVPLVPALRRQAAGSGGHGPSEQSSTDLDTADGGPVEVAGPPPSPGAD
jgi:membrane-associated phospholipid phosphatase